MTKIPKDCVAKVAAAMGDKIDAETLAFVRKKIEDGAAGVAEASEAEAMQSLANRFARQLKLAAVVERRNAALNALTWQRSVNYIETTWKGKYQEGMRVLLTGSIEGRKSARASAMREQYMLHHRYTGMLDSELEMAGVRELFTNDAVAPEVARALSQLRRDKPDMTGIGTNAQKIARIIRKYQDLARNDANAAGAWIGKLDDWIVMQSHDRWSIEKAGFQQWAAHIGERLDWNRIQMQEGMIADKAAWLREVYSNIVSGSHSTVRGAPNTTGFIGPRNVGKGMSHERVLHFKSPDSWMEYNAEYGKHSLHAAVIHGLSQSARNTGLMRVMGVNPEAMFNRLSDHFMQRVKETGDVKQIEKFREATAPGGWLRHRLAEVTGEVSNPVNHSAARWSAVVRAIQSMSKLGGAVLSSFPDIATYGSESNFQGRTFLSGVGEAIGGLVKGRPAAEQRIVLAELGVFFDSMISELSRVGNFDDSLPGSISRMQQRFFRLNLLDWWTEALRASHAMGMLHTLGNYKDMAFADLPKRQQAVFGLFDINEADWNAIRAGAQVSEDGKAFASANGLSRETADKLGRYISDRADQAVLKPDADAQAMMLRSQRPGTLHGELARFIMQFKSYGVGYARQVAGREIYGYGDTTLAEGSIGGLAKLIVASAILGYASMTTKEMLKGKKPRQPETPAQWKALVEASILQGGGFGIYGDFLFGQYSRFGSSALETVAGPTLSEANNAIKLFHMAKNGEDAGAAGLRLALGNTPYLNLFYVRPALDQAILYEMQEAINPGSMRRLERAAMRDRGQEYFEAMSPTAAVQ